MKRRAYHHGNLREALVAATLRAIAEDGPDGFTLRDVARRAGVSPAAPYRHFADKDELLAAVAIECQARLTEAIRAAEAQADPHPLEQFRASGIAYVRFAAAHPAHFRAMTIPGLFERLPAAQRASYEAAAAGQRAAIAAAQAAGLIAPIPLDQLLLAANSLVHGLAHQIVEGQLGEVGPERATALAIAVTSAFGVGLLPRGGALPADPLWTRSAAYADGALPAWPPVVAAASVTAPVAAAAPAAEKPTTTTEPRTGRRRRPRSAIR